MPRAPRPDLDPAALDVGHLALFVGYAFADAVMAALGEAGFADLRFSHGFLIQHLIEGGRTIGELAQRMEMTQQGASKAVAELEALGYVERGTDEDARVRRVQLSARGREALAATRRARERLAAAGHGDGRQDGEGRAPPARPPARRARRRGRGAPPPGHRPALTGLIVRSHRPRRARRRFSSRRA